MSLTLVGRTLSGLVTTSNVSALTPPPMRDTVVGCAHSALLTIWGGATTPPPMRDALAGRTYTWPYLGLITISLSALLTIMVTVLI
jgi:hypothetical protein